MNFLNRQEVFPSLLVFCLKLWGEYWTLLKHGSSKNNCSFVWAECGASCNTFAFTQSSPFRFCLIKCIILYAGRGSEEGWLSFNAPVQPHSQPPTLSHGDCSSCPAGYSSKYQLRVSNYSLCWGPLRHTFVYRGVTGLCQLVYSMEREGVAHLHSWEEGSYSSYIWRNTPSM